MYYIISEFIPDKNRFWKIPMYGEEVWIVHPNSFVTFERVCTAERAEIEKFEVTDEMVSAEIEKLQRQIDEGLIANFESTLRRYR